MNIHFLRILYINTEFRLPYMIPSKFTPPEFQKMTIPLEVIERMPSPRAIKSHLPFYLLPPKLLDTSKVNLGIKNVKSEL